MEKYTYFGLSSRYLGLFSPKSLILPNVAPEPARLASHPEVKTPEAVADEQPGAKWRKPVTQRQVSSIANQAWQSATAVLSSSFGLYRLYGYSEPVRSGAR